MFFENVRGVLKEGYPTRRLWCSLKAGNVMKHMKDAILKENPDFVGRVVDVEQTMLFLRAWFMGKGMKVCVP